MGKAHGCELFFFNENYQGFSNPKMQPLSTHP